ncbi:MAG: DUF433 domain-containing protein [Gemmatimonadota bacterium]
MPSSASSDHVVAPAREENVFTKDFQTAPLGLREDTDPRDLPAYSYTDASKALGIPPTTIGAWVRGQRYRRKSDTGFFEPVIRRPDPDDTRLSFKNLIEAHVLRSLRTSHDVGLGAVREALRIAEERYGIERLLIHADLKTSAGELFLDQYERLVTLSKAEQLVIRETFHDFLRRVEYDESSLPRLLFPITATEGDDRVPVISISPYISFGRPTISRTGISTAAIRARVDAGESVRHVADDYRLEPFEVEAALRYEVGVAA